MNEEPLGVELRPNAAAEVRPQALSATGWAWRQYLLGWSQPPQIALLQGGYLVVLPGLLGAFFSVKFAQSAGLTGGHRDVVAAALNGLLALIYLGLLALPALVILARGLRDLRARPRLVGGRVLAVQHVAHRSSQGHYIQLEMPNGRCERFRVDALWHNHVCKVGAQVALSVSPSLRYVSKVWSEAEEPPVLV